MNYEDAIALINEAPDATYVVQLDGFFYTLNGHTMRGFLVPSDSPLIDYFKRF